MKRIIYICFLFGMFSCEKEDLIEAFDEKNWYVIDYHENMDEVDQKIYDIYEKHGVAIFYKDTIGKEDRGWKDVNGNTNYYYEILKIKYDITSDSYLEYDLINSSTLESKKEILGLLELLDKFILPMIASIDIYLPCILVVDYLKELVGTEYLALRNFNFMTIANNRISAGKGSDDEYIFRFFIEFVSNGLDPYMSTFHQILHTAISELTLTSQQENNPFGTTYVTANTVYGELLNKIVKGEEAEIKIKEYREQLRNIEEQLLSEPVESPLYNTLLALKAYYEREIETAELDIATAQAYLPEYEFHKNDIHRHGCLGFSPSLGNGRNCFPTQIEDLYMFIELILTYAYEEVLETWQDYPYILYRYECLRAALLELNTDIEYINSIMKDLNN